MKSNIELPDLGELVYGKVYFAIDRPIIFQATFSDDNTKTVYVGLHLEAFDSEKWDCADPALINNYVLAPVTKKMLALLEDGKYTLKELYNEHPVLWISHRFNSSLDKHSTIFKRYTKINPVYCINDSATLSI